MQLTLRDLPKYERPRERLCEFGAHSLSIQELIQIIISQGTKRASVNIVAHDLIRKYQNLDHLEAASIQELCDTIGIGYAKAIQIKAAIELGKRFSIENVRSKSDSILNCDQAYAMAGTYFKGKKKEHLLLFNLDVRGKLITAPEILSVGLLDSSLVHPREIFNSAIKNHSSKIILAHNHPSGSSEPSVQDIEVTKQVFEAGLIIGIPLIDHLVIGSNEYSSIREMEPEIFEKVALLG